ncbi:hypothetical protein [Sphingobium lignivorans]|uniref:Uncharacterized protein n=1 Tax=Sphingobium lignivorans TaxID=2735886 RepID=A0ABR6NJD5_9SPHN|nr:hypothetical protein [Sphingobium lignivorans]MBB5987392.1 hypothetical protein [Sphingobium lignivorans]
MSSAGEDDPDRAGAMIEGLRLMLMAHIEAVDRQLPGSAQATAQSADVKRRAALQVGQTEAAEALELLLDELRIRAVIPAND